jgi:hypothetical protein
MFMCKNCHEADEDICNRFHRTSRGICEVCGSITDCYECTAYKHRDHLKERVHLTQDMRRPAIKENKGCLACGHAENSHGVSLGACNYKSCPCIAYVPTPSYKPSQSQEAPSEVSHKYIEHRVPYTEQELVDLIGLHAWNQLGIHSEHPVKFRIEATPPTGSESKSVDADCETRFTVVITELSERKNKVNKNNPMC